MLSTHNNIISSNPLSKEVHTIIVIFIACLLPVTPTPTRIQASIGQWFSQVLNPQHLEVFLAQS